MWNSLGKLTRPVRDYQIRINSLKMDERMGIEILEVDGMRGAKTLAAVEAAKDYYGYTNADYLFDPSGIQRVHWHWTAGSYTVTEETRSHYNMVIDHKGQRYDGGSPAAQQAHYAPGKVGVSHTLNANTGAIGISVACMGNATESSGSVDMGKYPMTWVSIDAMLEATAEYCREFDIRVSPWTTLSHAEVQENLGIKQRGKWDIRVLPDRPTKLLTAREAGDVLRERMVEKFW